MRQSCLKRGALQTSGKWDVSMIFRWATGVWFWQKAELFPCVLGSSEGAVIKCEQLVIWAHGL